MSILIGYWDTAAAGFGRFAADYKYIALVICILVYGIICWKQYEKRSVRILLLYTMIVTVLLMIPFTCIPFLYYQTRFYDYEWIWSLVPLTIILAWGIVTAVFEEISTKKFDNLKGKEGHLAIERWCGFLAAAAILFMCGNQGQLQRMDQTELQMQQRGSEILNYMEEEDMLQDHVIWGPAGIMQYMRSHNGRVILYYGRDMWDAKSGAYDYETYSAEETACYEWMEEVSSDLNQYLLEVDQAPDKLYEFLSTEVHIRNAVLGGADMIILPNSIDDRMIQKMQLIGNENELEVTSAKVGEYTIWMFEQRGYDG